MTMAVNWNINPVTSGARAPPTASERLLIVIPATNNPYASAASQATGPPRAAACVIPRRKFNPRQAPMTTGPSHVRFRPAS